MSNRDGLQDLLGALGKLSNKSSVKLEDITALSESVVAKSEENQTRIEVAKETFTTPYPKSRHMFDHGRKEDGSARLSRRFTTWRDHEFGDGGNLLEEGGSFERE